MHSAPQTDFWRLTHSGVIADNGHLYYQRHNGDFQADVKITGQYKDLYDQAGLMLRANETQWLKCGIELFEGIQHASAVVTHEYSDWSVVALHPAPASLWLRVTYKDATIEVHYSLNGTSYFLLRQAYLTTTESIDVGMFCASPTGSGFTVTFDGFTVQNI